MLGHARPSSDLALLLGGASLSHPGPPLAVELLEDTPSARDLGQRLRLKHTILKLLAAGVHVETRVSE